MIGDLRVRLRLERPEFAGAGIVFADAGGAWASVETADDGARFAFGVRARPDVRAGWRLVWDARRFRILAVIGADKLGARLTLIAAEELT